MSIRRNSFYPSVVLALLFVMLSALDPQAQQLLRWDRLAIEGGQYYRLFSGHFVHLGVSHAMLNAVALVLIGWIFRYALSLGDWLITVIFCCLFISLGLLWLTHVAWYVGFSGVLHGLFLVSLLRDRLAMRWKLCILVLMAVKLLVGLIGGGNPLTETFVGGQVVVSAHWLGAAAGFVMYLYFRLFRTSPGD